MLTRDEFEKLPIFIATMSRWDGDISSASLSLAKVFSRSNPVFYIDYPYSWADVWRERKLPTVKRRMSALLFGKDYLIHVPNQSEQLNAVTPNAVLPIGFLPFGSLYQLFSAINNKIFARLIKRTIKEKKIRDYIFLNSFNPFYLSDVHNYLNPTLSVYHSRDTIEAVKGNGVIRENECAENYDMVMATSKQICHNILKRTGIEVNYFPNGGDITLFRKAIEQQFDKPEEIANIKTPIIGYTGAVCQRMDYYLLEKIAKANQDKTIVMVGPRQDKTYSPINLDAIPNIVFTGPKKIDQLPAYLQYFDCTIIPFLCNDLTAGIYPLKINEYLGAGKAIVTTNFSEDIAAFEKHVYLSDTHEEFLDNISKAIADNSDTVKNERLMAASGNDWSYRVKRFWDLAWEAYQKKQNL